MNLKNVLKQNEMRRKSLFKIVDWSDPIDTQVRVL